MMTPLQFGDQFGDIFIFPPYETEVDISFSKTTSFAQKIQSHGSIRLLGCSDSLLAQRDLTVRFKLYLPEVEEELMAKSCCPCDDKNQLKRQFRDYLYRTLNGGVKRLYFRMEDGTVRYINAEAINMPNSFTFQTIWEAYAIDFVATDPFFYSCEYGEVGWTTGLPYSAHICKCNTYSGIVPGLMVSGLCPLPCEPLCAYGGVLLRNKVYEQYMPPCDKTIESGSVICVDGSYGAGNYCVTSTSSVKNKTNGTSLTITGNAGESVTVCIPKDYCDISEAEISLDGVTVDGDFSLDAGNNIIETEDGETFELDYQNIYW